VHVHRTSVTLIDGTVVVGVTFLEDDPYSREASPTFGLYLDERWSPPWPHSHVDWPDFGLPADPDAFGVALRDALARASHGERVEVGCLGGHGRTGTALACLAVLAGTPASEAVAWVRANYCDHAVETGAQEAFVLDFHRGQP
jgi:protein-tyrosine phosphatase